MDNNERIVMLKPVKEIEENGLKIEIYEINNYRVKKHYLGDDVIFRIKPIHDNGLVPEIGIDNDEGSGYIKIDLLYLKPEDIDQFTNNVQIAKDTIEQLKKLL